MGTDAETEGEGRKIISLTNTTLRLPANKKKQRQVKKWTFRYKILQTNGLRNLLNYTIFSGY